MIAVPIPELADLFQTIIIRAILAVALACALPVLFVGLVAAAVHCTRQPSVRRQERADDYDEAA